MHGAGLRLQPNGDGRYYEPIQNIGSMNFSITGIDISLLNAGGLMGLRLYTVDLRYGDLLAENSQYIKAIKQFVLNYLTLEKGCIINL